MYKLIRKIYNGKENMYIVQAGSSVSVLDEKEYRFIMRHENDGRR